MSMEQKVVMRCLMYIYIECDIIYKDTTNSVEVKGRNNTVFTPQDHIIPLITKKIRTGFYFVKNANERGMG